MGTTTRARIDYTDTNHVKAFCESMRQDNVVVVKETHDNTGMSVTNAIELVAAAVCENYSIAPAALHLFELYVIKGQPQVSRVSFSKVSPFTGPSWAHMDADSFVQTHFPIEPIYHGDSY